MAKKIKYFLLVIFFALAGFSFLQTTAIACSCSPGPRGTNIGIEYIACGINVEDDDVVTYTVHNNIICSGSSFYKPGYYWNYTQTGTPAGIANWLAGNGAYRVFKTGAHILAIHSNFHGEICGVKVTDYDFGVVHNDIITCCLYIFPPLGETNDRDGDGIVDCIDNCPDYPNPDQGPCPTPLDTADTKDKELGIELLKKPIQCPQKFKGNPINIFNGNNLEKETDFAFNSPFEGGLTFKRYYNSQSASDSTIGFGWTHNYDLVLYPDFNESNLLIKIVSGTGRGYYFEDFDEDGIFKGAFSENSSIIKDQDGNYI